MFETTRFIGKPELQQLYQGLETFVQMAKDGGFYQSLGNCKNTLGIHKQRRTEDYDKLCILSRQSSLFYEYGNSLQDDQNAATKGYQREMLKDWLEHNAEVELHPAYKHVFTEKQQTFLTLLTKGLASGDKTDPDFQNRSPSFRQACQEATKEKHPLIGELGTANSNHSKALFEAENAVTNYETDLDYWIQQGQDAFSAANSLHPDSDEWNDASQRAAEVLQRAQKEIEKLTETAKQAMQSLDASYKSPKQIVDDWLKAQKTEKEQQPEPQLKTPTVDSPAIAPREDVSAIVLVTRSSNPHEQLRQDIAAKADTLCQQLRASGDINQLLNDSEAAFAKAKGIAPDRNGNFASDDDRNA